MKNRNDGPALDGAGHDDTLEGLTAARAIDAEERQPITPERLAEIEAREQATVEGPWLVDRDIECDSEIGPVNFRPIKTTLDMTVCYALAPFMADEADFIAHARQDVRDLCAEVRRCWAGESTALFLAREDARIAQESRIEALREVLKLREDLAREREASAELERCLHMTQVQRGEALAENERLKKELAEALDGPPWENLAQCEERLAEARAREATPRKANAAVGTILRWMLERNESLALNDAFERCLNDAVNRSFGLGSEAPE